MSVKNRIAFFNSAPLSDTTRRPSVTEDEEKKFEEERKERGKEQIIEKNSEKLYTYVPPSNKMFELSLISVGVVLAGLGLPKLTKIVIKSFGFEINGNGNVKSFSFSTIKNTLKVVLSESCKFLKSGQVLSLVRVGAAVLTGVCVYFSKDNTQMRLDNLENILTNPKTSSLSRLGKVFTFCFKEIATLLGRSIKAIVTQVLGLLSEVFDILFPSVLNLSEQNVSLLNPNSFSDNGDLKN